MSKYWAVVTIYNYKLWLTEPELFGPFDTELERDNVVAEFITSDDEIVVSYFKFSLPAGVEPGDQVAGVEPAMENDCEDDE